MTKDEMIAALEADDKKKKQGKSREEMIAELEAADTAPEPKTQKEKEAWYEDFVEGAVVSGMGTALGIKELFTDLSPEEKQKYADLKADAAESGWGTAGQVAGEIGQLLAPTGVAGAAVKFGTKIPKLVKAGQAVRKFQKAKPVISDMVTGAALGAAKLPEEEDSRLARAVGEGALAGVAGGVTKLAGKTLKKAAQGIKRTPEGQSAIDKGLKVTPGQAAESPFVQMQEVTTSSLPHKAKGLALAKETPQNQWRADIIHKALPDEYAGSTISTGNVRSAYNTVDTAFNKEYAKAWNSSTGVSPQTADELLEAVDETIENFSLKDEGVFQTIRKNIVKLAEEGGTPKQLNALDGEMSRAMSTKASKDNALLFQKIKTMKGWLRENSLPPESMERLVGLDKKYPAKLTLRKAINKASDNKGKFTPKQLSASGKTVAGEQREALGLAPFREEADFGIDLFNREVPASKWLTQYATYLSGALNPMSRQTTSRAFLGQTAPQQVAQKIGASPLSQGLRKYTPSAGKVGAGMYGNF